MTSALVNFAIQVLAIVLGLIIFSASAYLILRFTTYQDQLLDEVTNLIAQKTIEVKKYSSVVYKVDSRFDDLEAKLEAISFTISAALGSSRVTNLKPEMKFQQPDLASLAEKKRDEDVPQSLFQHQITVNEICESSVSSDADTLTISAPSTENLAEEFIEPKTKKSKSKSKKKSKVRQLNFCNEQTDMKKQAKIKEKQIL